MAELNTRMTERPDESNRGLVLDGLHQVATEEKSMQLRIIGKQRW